VKPPKYVYGFVDKCGRKKYYLRRPGHKNVAIPGLLWSPEMMAAVQAAMTGTAIPATALVIGASRTKAGSLQEASTAYFESAGFVALVKSKPVRATEFRRQLVRFANVENADDRPRGMLPLCNLSSEVLKAIMVELQPHAQRHLIGALRPFMAWCVSTDRIKADPTVGLKHDKLPTAKGAVTGQDQHLEKFRARWALGTRERVALEVLAFTGARRGDAILLGDHLVKDGLLTFTPSKTADRTGRTIVMPVPRRIREAVDAMPRRIKDGGGVETHWLLNSNGRPWANEGGFYNFFKAACVEAGVDELSPHSMRKWLICHLLSRSMTVEEVCAITGHSKHDEVLRYARELNRKGNAVKSVAVLDEVA
jgi:site-specific recombinase XerD